MKSSSLILSFVTAVAISTVSIAAQARDQIRIVGSSTVFPFSAAVAEQFGKSTKFNTPIVESTGSGGGLKLFCAGTGDGHPDITNASRRIKKSEVETCAKNGIKEITEVKIGYDGIVLANSKAAEQINLTREQMFMALAKMVPNGDGWQANPNKTWSDIDANLPNSKIEVMGPPPTSGTRDAFVELVMDEACKAIIGKDAAKANKENCRSMREDGAFIEAGENDNLIVQKLESNKDAFGIFGFSFLDQNADKVQGSKIDNIAPEFEAIADGSYPVSRALYFYVKNAHVGNVPGIKEYLNEFTSEKAWGDDGYLADKGLIPMPSEERAQFKKGAEGLVNLDL